MCLDAEQQGKPANDMINVVGRHHLRENLQYIKMKLSFVLGTEDKTTFSVTGLFHYLGVEMPIVLPSMGANGFSLHSRCSDSER